MQAGIKRGRQINDAPISESREVNTVVDVASLEDLSCGVSLAGRACPVHDYKKRKFYLYYCGPQLKRRANYIFTLCLLPIYVIIWQHKRILTMFCSLKTEYTASTMYIVLVSSLLRHPSASSSHSLSFPSLSFAWIISPKSPSLSNSS